MSDSLIHHAAEIAGILPFYHGLDGTEHTASIQTKSALLSAMGVDVSPDTLSDFIDAHNQQVDLRSLPTSWVVTSGHSTPFPTRAFEARVATLEAEDGGLRELDLIDGAELPALGPGYYRLRIGATECTVFAAPEQAPSVEKITGHARQWGVTSGLYGLISARTRGIGDYEDLAQIAETLGGRGAGFLGINPIHALQASADAFSPYSPTHRGFLNTRHIAVDQVPEFEWSDVAQQLWFGTKTSVAGQHIDYGTVDTLRMEAMRAVFNTLEHDPRAADRRIAFDAFLKNGPDTLHNFAVFECLSLVHGVDWRHWPIEYQNPSTQAVQQFAVNHKADVRFHAYLQWIARSQVTTAQTRARASGMGLGLYTDLAVGVVPGGAETWMSSHAFARGVSLGAPPDGFNAYGQRWNLSPLNPLSLKNDSFAPFINTIRAALLGAGMMRVDHVIGLQRSFWVPDDPNASGGYVAYPRDELFAILKIEAHRARAVVVGEDLGVVPEGFRSELEKSGLYGCSVLAFEREYDGTLKHPKDYRPMSIACIGTHDTPTFNGYWTSRDIDARVNSGQSDMERADRECAERHTERERFHNLIEDHDHATGQDEELAATVLDGLYNVLADGTTHLIAIQLEDILHQLDQPNMPGTVDEYPNWRLTYAATIEEISDDIRLDRLSRIMAKDGYRLSA